MKIKIQDKDGLLYTSIKLTHERNSVVIYDVIIDTGAKVGLLTNDLNKNFWWISKIMLRLHQIRTRI